MSVLPTTTYKVRIVCRTFNHARYIKDALNGFCIQETKFPFVAIIIDDASTDGEAEIISQYLKDHFDMVHAQHDENEDAKRIAAVHKNNPNCHFLVILLKYNFYSIKKAQYPLYKGWYENVPFIATCEGDDYWTDSLKLQKQVDFMECNCDYTLCFHSVFEKYEGRSNLNKVRAIVEDREYSGLEWYKDRPSQFASFLFRSWIEKDPYYTKIENNRRFIARDVPLLLSCAHLGKIRGMSDVMSVYRHNETGWTQNVRSKNEIIRIIDSQLEYGVFGKEFERLAISYYNRECVKAFIYSFKGKPDFSFIPISWKKSKMGTIIAFVSVIVSIVKSKIRVL